MQYLRIYEEIQEFLMKAVGGSDGSDLDGMREPVGAHIFYF